MWRRTCLVGVAVSALLVGACSDGTDESTAGSDPPTSDSTEESETECSPARETAEGSERRTLESGGVERTYDVSVPSSYDGTEPVPLIVDLHGFSSNATQQSALSGMPAAAGERGYVVVTPQALEVDVPLTTGTLNTTFWNIDPAAVRPGFDPPDDLGFLDGMLDEVDETLCIDTSRQYVTGMSNGAGMTMALACGEDTRFAAAAPVAGANLVGTCEPGRSIPLFAVHGDADPLVPYAGGQVVGQDYQVVAVEERLGALAELAGCSPEPELTTPFDDIEVRTWADCSDGVDVVLTTVLGGGHTWPGSTLEFEDPEGSPDAPPGQQEFLEGFDFSAVAGNQTNSIETTELVLDFFDAHPATP